MMDKRKDLPSEPVRGRGRPKSDEPLLPVTTRLRPRERDRLSQIALRSGISESKLVRRLIIIHLGGS